MRLVAFYLPQYYPTETNNKWYGEGFTEWTNVAKAKPLFRGHYEPHIPADLGFYDLRVPEVRRKQAQMAQSCGIEAFCYWTYWFGNGVTELDMPIWEVYKDKEITLPFCLAWGNTSWNKKFWDKDGNMELIQKQEYLGPEDYKKYFYHMLPLFKDPRYFRVGDKLLFSIHTPLDNSEAVKEFISCWHHLSKEAQIDDFYFVGADSGSRNKDKVLSLGFDAIYNMNTFNIHHELSLPRKVRLAFERKVLGKPTTFKYKDAVKYMVSDECKEKTVIPVVAPNWDHSPRSGRNSIILVDCKPRYFKELLYKTKEIVSVKEPQEQVVFVQAWNEWGEGNHLEPDLKYGWGYLDAVAEVMGKERHG